MRSLPVRVGARASRLSQAQTAIVSDLLRTKLGEAIALQFVQVRTVGDRRPGPGRDLGRAGAKGAFTADIEALLLNGDIDIAVHSMKDLTSSPSEGLFIGATPPRSDPRDALVTSLDKTIQTLPKGARVGTSSLRRRAQLLKLRRDLEVVELHGNVDTRIRKVGGAKKREGENDLDAVVLAVAGLQRIGEVARISQKFSIDEMVPAVGQGTIAVQMRRGDREIARILSEIDDPTARVESECERAFALQTGADCDLPIGGCARVSGQRVKIVGMIAEEDGSGLRQSVVVGPSRDATALGRKLAEELLEGAAS